jgi:hypothetical protein
VAFFWQKSKEDKSILKIKMNIFQSDMTSESAQSAAAEALALVVKSEVVPTVLKNQYLLRNNS